MVGKHLYRLPPDGEVALRINGHVTIWQRMKPGNARPTNAVRLAQGRPVWDPIPIGSELELALADEPSVLRRVRPADHGQRFQRVASIGARGSDRPRFDWYLFSDYSGAVDRVQQKRVMKSSCAEDDRPPQLIDASFTRDTLVVESVARMRRATETSRRGCLGNDHQYGIPYALADEIGLRGCSWRQALEALATGAYGGPPLGPAKVFASRFNDWLRSKGKKPYFWSATKHAEYGVPTTNPRPANDPSTVRLTELCLSASGRGRPMPFNRLGDRGCVGGQTLVGLLKIRELLLACEQLKIPVRCWPMDGLDIASPTYDGAHVLFEPYPSACRAPDVAQSDAADALAAARLVWERDRAGRLTELLDLSALSAAERRIVRFEGWIIGHLPERR